MSDRLLDRVLVSEASAALPSGDLGPAVFIQNVEDYVTSLHGGDKIDRPLHEVVDIQKDLANIAPPFPAFWLESKTDCGDGVQFQWGFFIRGAVLDEESKASITGRLGKLLRERDAELEDIAADVLAKEFPDEWKTLGEREKAEKASALAYATNELDVAEGDVSGTARALFSRHRHWLESERLKWLMNADYFMWSKPMGDEPIHAGSCLIPVRDDGATMVSDERPTGGPDFVLRRLTREFERTIERPGCPVNRGTMMGVMETSLTMALMAISFMHCKNVELDKDKPPSKVLAKLKADRNAKRGKPVRGISQQVEYRVLRIGPLKKILEGEGGARNVGIGKALHICRGHFKTYRERGLFGRPDLTGTFWWPMHIKGDKKRGKVVKDYEIKTEDSAFEKLNPIASESHE